jgi:hypothetical protein
MANNDDNQRRNRDPLEDNPFIAFRRFADSQVSSLLNTVFSIPATIANHNAAHQAREACLFKKADKRECDYLRELESDIRVCVQEGQRQVRAGDMQQAMKIKDAMTMLEHEAETMRNRIVGTTQDDQSDKEIVEKFANRKGQEWGWDWSWGFPKPFDDDSTSSRQSTKQIGEIAECRQRQEEAFEQIQAECKRVFGDRAWDDAMGLALGTMESSPFMRAIIGQDGYDQIKKTLEQAKNEDHNVDDTDSANSRVWEITRPTGQAASQHRVFQVPDDKTSISCPALEDPRTAARWADMRDGPGYHRDLETGEWRRAPSGSGQYPKRVPWDNEETKDEPSYEYSHDHEDQHDDPPTPKVKQDPFQPQPQESAEGTAHRVETEDRQIQAYLLQQAAQNGRYLGLSDAAAADDRPCTWTEQDAQTELDAYEHLFAKPRNTPPAPAPSNLTRVETTTASPPSILSTLTTTERSVAPDGSVTTKVVLKKRFADGREESTETVHTQRGLEEWSHDPWAGIQKALTPDQKESKNNESREKKRGWFWST